MSDPPPADPLPAPAPDGITCPACTSCRLVVTHTKTHCPGLRIRYVACEACACRFRTHETVARITKPGGAKK